MPAHVRDDKPIIPDQSLASAADTGLNTATSTIGGKAAGLRTLGEILDRLPKSDNRTPLLTIAPPAGTVFSGIAGLPLGFEVSPELTARLRELLDRGGNKPIIIRSSLNHDFERPHFKVAKQPANAWVHTELTTTSDPLATVESLLVIHGQGLLPDLRNREFALVSAFDVRLEIGDSSSFGSVPVASDIRVLVSRVPGTEVKDLPNANWEPFPSYL